MRFLRTVVMLKRHVLCQVVLVIGMMYLFTFSVSAQDVEQVIKQKPVKVSGGVAANTTFYNAQGIANRRDPFYWMLNANLNFNFFGIIQAPFSMTLSQQKKNFSQPQPFNRFGISPKYKMVTTHFGYRSMSFSEYSLAGTMFLGAGVDVVPTDGFVRVSAMHGRLTKAVEKSAQEGLVFAKPAFKRIGYGVKVGLGRKKHMVDLILFKAKDDEQSITVTDAELTPEENLVGAIHSKHEFSDKVAVELEYAYSMFTRDVRAEKPETSNYSFVNNLGGLFKPNLSSEFNKALTAVVNYNGGWYQANIKYRKIDPGYRTLGAAFLNNGMKDLTGGLGWSMFQQKINISTNAGFQESTKENSVVRVIYAVNVNYNVNTRVAIGTNYSNFSTSTRQTQIQRDIRYDTLEYFQVTRSGNANVSYKFGPDTNPQTLSLTASVQDATDNGQSTSTFYSLNLGHQVKVAGLWQLGVAASYNKNYSVAMNTTTVGPVLNLNRPFLKGKIRSACSAALLKSYLDNTLQSDVANISLTNSMKVGKKHSIAVNMYYLNSSEKKEDGREYSEIRGMVNYSYSF